MDHASFALQSCAIVLESCCLVPQVRENGGQVSLHEERRWYPVADPCALLKGVMMTGGFQFQRPVGKE